jgi:ABC transporter substrate binding protein (PQQ-dependent alcohol dehydrogenase system)
MAAFRRPMNARDDNAWLAMRMIGEATTRTATDDVGKVLDYTLSPEFSIAAFKGVRQTSRPWNNQLRQPILLSDRRMVISVSAQEGLLHLVTELDTLGFDRPETKCKK